MDYITRLNLQECLIRFNSLVVDLFGLSVIEFMVFLQVLHKF